MAYTVPRPKLSFAERLYFPSIMKGMKITIGHLIRLMRGKTKVTMQYPEEKWDESLPEMILIVPPLPAFCR